MESVLEVARQLAGSSGAVYFVGPDGPYVRVGVFPTDAPLRELWRLLARGQAVLLEHGPHVVVVDRGPDGAPRGALAFERTPTVARRIDALLGLVRALEALRETEQDSAVGTSGYERWLLSESPRSALVCALEASDWNVSALAELWGCSRPCLYRAVRRYGIALNRTPVACRRAARRRLA